MRWDTFNILEGAASVQLFASRKSYQELTQTINLRARQDGYTLEQALTQVMRERLLGQCLIAVTSLLFIFLAVMGVQQGWPDPAVAAFGCGPAALMCLTARLRHTNAKRHK